MRYLILLLSLFSLNSFAGWVISDIELKGQVFDSPALACKAANDLFDKSSGNHRLVFLKDNTYECWWMGYMRYSTITKEGEDCPSGEILNIPLGICEKKEDPKKCDFELLNKEIPFGVIGTDGKILQTHADAPASACISSCGYDSLSYDDFYSKGNEPGSAVTAKISYRGTGQSCEPKDGEDGSDGKDGENGSNGNDGGNTNGNDNGNGDNDGTGSEGDGKGEGYAKDSTLKEGIDEIGSKIDDSNELLKGIKDAIGKIPGGGGGGNNDNGKCTGVGCEYDSKAEWSDAEAEKSGRDTAAKIKAELEDELNIVEEERKEKFNEFIEKIPTDIEQVFGPEGQKIPSVKKIEDVIPKPSGCSPIRISVPLGKYSSEMIIDVCLLSKAKILLEWVFYALTAIGVWNIFYAGLRLENAKASRGNF